MLTTVRWSLAKQSLEKMAAATSKSDSDSIVDVEDPFITTPYVYRRPCGPQRDFGHLSYVEVRCNTSSSSSVLIFRVASAVAVIISLSDIIVISFGVVAVKIIFISYHHHNYLHDRHNREQQHLRLSIIINTLIHSIYLQNIITTAIIFIYF